MRRFRVVSGVVALILLNYILFAPEINATFWHLSHGSYVDLEEVRFEIPWLYRVESTSNRNTFNAWSLRGIAREHYSPSPMGFSSIDVEMRPQMISHTPIDPVREAYYLEKTGMKQAGEFKASAAGRSGICKRTTSVDLITPDGDPEIRISCVLGSDLSITYSGPARKAFELDNFLKNAKTLSQKR